MIDWGSLTFAEQTLMRHASYGGLLAGCVQIHGIDLRWAGAADAPPLRSYTDAEQRALVPMLAEAALGLVGSGCLSIRESRWMSPSADDAILTDQQVRNVLADADNWMWNPGHSSGLRLEVPTAVREQLAEHAWPTADASGLPAWDDLTAVEQDILICAQESSGMLTGDFGDWPDPPAHLDAEGRRAFVDEQLAPLVPFVRAGWIEVRHIPDADSDAFTVIPLDALHTAFADLDLRYQGEEWGIGFTCAFTHAGLAVRRGGAWQ